MFTVFYWELLSLVCSIRWPCKALSTERYMPHQLHPSRYMYVDTTTMECIRLSDIKLRISLVIHSIMYKHLTIVV